VSTGAGTPWWAEAEEALLARVAVGLDGLSDDEAARRLRELGPNQVEAPRGHRGLRLLIEQFANPIILILVGATAVSMGLGDLVDGGIILAIVAASGLLGFVQEHRAGRAVDALAASIRVHADLRRAGRDVAVPIDQVVTGDVVVLGAGDVVPGDCRVLEARSLVVDEAVLTGESYPVDKAPGVVEAGAALARRTNALFLGTHVVSGSGLAVVVATGRDTAFGAVSHELGGHQVKTRFEQGITAFGLLLVRAMVVLVTAIFVVNVALHRPFVEALLFSLALAVGLTPQLLPAIVAIGLATGAQRMAAEQVIVRRLDAIEDFGAMTVLCTDKTGTLTAGAVRLDAAVDLDGEADAEVLALAAANAGLQRGYENPIDQAILAVAERPEGRALAEVPYDFTRRRLSVLVAPADGGAPLLITKGAVTEVLEACATARRGGRSVPLGDERAAVEARFAELSAGGFRVLALATGTFPAGRDPASLDPADEQGLELRGLLAFHDPPKPGVHAAIGDLAEQGISVRLVTGDNRLAAAQVAEAVGLDGADVMTGAELDALDDEALTAAAASTTVFAEVEPLHKERIVSALRRSGAVVGFLGDGINDAVALHAADVGISVDTAVDVAKQTAAIVLLDKSLAVVSDGVRLGRQTFANTLKYIRVTTSANFGNMLSLTVAAAFLPFLPLLPRQILLLNFLSDIPGLTIAEDAVDPEQLAAPRAWRIRAIRTFMVTYGLISSVFDIATFAVLRIGFDAAAPLFRSGWFVESTFTELAVMLVLRTNRVFLRSRPGRGLLWTSVATGVVTVALPYSPLAHSLGLVGLPATIVATLAGLILVYVAANELAKRWAPPAA
jgi:Mg2+-importing ATPase